MSTYNKPYNFQIHRLKTVEPKRPRHLAGKAKRCAHHTYKTTPKTRTREFQDVGVKLFRCWEIIDSGSRNTGGGHVLSWWNQGLLLVAWRVCWWKKMNIKTSIVLRTSLLVITLLSTELILVVGSVCWGEDFDLWIAMEKFSKKIIRLDSWKYWVWEECWTCFQDWFWRSRPSKQYNVGRDYPSSPPAPPSV